MLEIHDTLQNQSIPHLVISRGEGEVRNKREAEREGELGDHQQPLALTLRIQDSGISSSRSALTLSRVGAWS